MGDATHARHALKHVTHPNLAAPSRDSPSPLAGRSADSLCQRAGRGQPRPPHVTEPRCWGAVTSASSRGRCFCQRRRMAAALLAKTLLAAAAAPLCYLRLGAAPRLPFSCLGFGRGLASAPLTRRPAGPALLASSQLPALQPALGMKTKGVIKRRCKDCFIVRRRGRLFVYCKTHPRHKQRLL